ncbi:gamma-glutamyl-gamma-aminobutyrate hydrolase family protein [Sphingosinicella sp. BN140058]|uniref:gamma-glutamyl-gamma-aminobutyrate hydrolase family protein n=1 Tax=Sphingosinicella sp. BN140058 TaxID=1892855 RepID=UPI0010131875|nr:gamma-glutamyl-gamma-aminobutyrate hydrolase family protein [Sphingosinicella sp. BN140058]QAY75761.1 gamma-glutamyl-gamma-aminobutyrate hydrolase family protein [Sphingosinicella sp. BN140058]
MIHLSLPERARPVIGVLCCNEQAGRPIQAVASRFIEPLARLAGAAVLLVPALSDPFDARAVARRLDGLLLTGSRSNVAAHRYGGRRDDFPVDEQRDDVAMALAAHMIEEGRPVFGICRGLQELNVLFGGSLEQLSGHHRDEAGDIPFEDLFAHRHDVDLTEGGIFAAAAGNRRISVNSVHHQGIGRLGQGLRVEAIAAEDNLVEAFSSRPCGADLLAVQWHPEWETARCPASGAFFARIGEALRARDGPWIDPAPNTITMMPGDMR